MPTSCAAAAADKGSARTTATSAQQICGIVPIFHSHGGGELTEADASTIDEIVQRGLDRLAFFVGSRRAHLRDAEADIGIAVRAPGREGGVLCRVEIEGLPSLAAIADDEDREACRMLLDLDGTAVERVERERERERLLLELKDRELQLESLVEQICSAQEEERRRVAYELHDGVAQTATALVRLLEGADAQEVTARSCGKDEQLIAIARGLVSELRGVIAGLRPTILDDLGLSAALEALCDDLERDGYRLTRQIAVGDQRLPAAMEAALFRVAQEAISNIRKHAGSTCPVLIEADLRQRSGQAFLRITDAGKGLHSAKDREKLPHDGGYHVGIEGMKERMARIGVTLDLRAGEAGGVTVEARLPVDR